MRTVLRTGGMVDIPSLGEIRAEIEAGVGARVGAEVGQLRDQVTGELGNLAGAVESQLATLNAQQRELARAVKWMRFPRLRGTPKSSALAIGGTTGFYVGPESGYLWSVRRLTITGLTASPTAPDIVNFYYTDATGSAAPVWWQLNGNSFGTEFDMGGMMMRGGECLNVASVGTFAATGTIVVDWDGWEVPEDQAVKLING